MIQTKFVITELDAVASKLIKQFNWGDVVDVHGAMGFGKTTLIRAMIQAFDPTQTPASPTFAIMSVHPLRHPNAFVHIDAYRIQSAQELINLGIDQLDLDHAITFVEWCERIPSEMLTPNKKLTLSLGQSEHERIIQYDEIE